MANALKLRQSAKNVTFRTMYIKKTLALCLLVWTSVSCHYELPDDKYFKHIDQLPNTSVITLADYENNDTIVIYQPSKFQFSVSAPNVKITKVEILLGSDLLYSFTTAEGAFTLNDLYRINNTTLKIQVTSDSGTGSLADKLGKETTTVWRTWVIQVDTTPPLSPVLSASIENGFLKVSWTPFKKGSFQQYTIHSNINFNFPTVITDPNVTSYIDSTYVSGSNTYYVSIMAATGWASAQLTINTPQAASFTYHAPDSTVKLVWKKSVYTAAFQNAVITQDGTVINTITSPTDTTYTFRLVNAAFGSSPTIELTINPQDHGPLYPYYPPFTFTGTIDNPTGASQIIPDQMLYYSQALNTLVGFNPADRYTRIYNAAMKVADSIFVGSGFSLPYPGKYAYYSLNSSIIQRNLLDGTTKTYPFSDPTYYALVVVGAANGFVAYEAVKGYYPTYLFEVVDMNTLTPIQNNVLWLSDDGKYHNNGQFLYSYNGSQFIFTQVEPVSDAKYRPDDCNELIGSGTPTIILNGVAGTILRTITPPGVGYTRKTYDPATHMILYTKEGSNKSYLINIDTQDVTVVNGTGVAFMSGCLIDSKGYVIKLM